VKTADIERRLAALERALATDEKLVRLVVRFIGPDGAQEDEMVIQLAPRPVALTVTDSPKT